MLTELVTSDHPLVIASTVDVRDITVTSGGQVITADAVGRKVN